MSRAPTAGRVAPRFFPHRRRRLGLALGLGLRLAAALSIAVASAGCAPALLHVALGTERGQGNLREHELVVGGVRHSVLTRRGDGPTAVLLHGFGGDKDNWTRMAAHLPSSWTLLIPDLAGFGHSERRDDVHHDVVAQAERVHLLIQHAASRPVILVGNSMGGHIAAATAALYPADVAFLVLVDPAGIVSPEPSEVGAALARGEPNPLLTTSVADFDRVMGLMFVHPPALPDVVKSHFAARASANRPWNDRVFHEMRQHPFLLESHLGDIHAKTLVLWGADDKVLHPSGGPVFVNGIHDARLVIMEGTGHTPMIERPLTTATVVADFVAMGR